MLESRTRKDQKWDMLDLQISMVGTLWDARKQRCKFGACPLTWWGVRAIFPHPDRSPTQQNAPRVFLLWRWREEIVQMRQCVGAVTALACFPTPLAVFYGWDAGRPASRARVILCKLQSVISCKYKSTILVLSYPHARSVLWSFLIWKVLNSSI